MSRQDTEESTAADLAAAAPERANSATRTFFRGRFTFQFGQPLVISEREEIVPPFTEEQSALGRQIGLTFKAYREAAKSLLVEKYQALREIVPPHLRSECDCLVIVCDDGVVVRYDRQTGDAPKVRTGIIEDSDRSVTAVAPKLSEQYVFFPLDPTGFELPPEGPRLQLFTISGTTGERTLLADARLGIVVPWGELRQQPPAPARPVPLVSVTNEFDFLTQGELFNEGDEARPGTGQPFVTRSHVKLAVGWETIEVYPPFDPGVWQPSVAPLWAELDLLAAATRRNQQDQQFQAVDPHAAARKHYSALFKEFQTLLDGLEAPVQAFLQKHPELLDPTHTKMWPKLPIGARITDFVFREAAGDYLLVEIEAPIRTLFRGDGQPHAELTHAIDQIVDWLRYIEDNLATVQRELGLTGISTSPNCLIVIGRAGDLTLENRRKLVTMQNMVPKLRIVTYDDLLAMAKANVQNLLGPLWETEGDVEVYYGQRA